MDMSNFNGQSFAETAGAVSNAVKDFVQGNEALNFWVAVVVFAIGVIFLVLAIHGKLKKGLENSIYIVYCSFVLAIVAVAIVTWIFGTEGEYAYLGLGAYAAYVSLPAIFCLHVWSQTSHRKIGIGRVIGYFVVPAVLTVIAVMGYMGGSFVPDVWHYQLLLPLSSYAEVLLVGYWVVMVMKSLLLCFNVFYQMPKHMRGSSGLLIAAIAVFNIECIFAMFSGSRSSFMLCLIALAFVLERAFAGFFRASASNVIATSREFVYSNLSTLVIILSKKGRVLDWNRGYKNFVFSLLPPKYRQPFSHYKEKLLKIGEGVVSIHDENIITLTKDGEEHHLLIASAPIKEGEREFGQLVEISDVTHIYSVLRYLESIAVYDHLTKLYNRSAYLERASRAISRENLPLLVIVGDVNNLKLVNDNVGHLAGDKLLVSIAGIIHDSVPPNAFAARIGGDEIAVLVPNADEDVAIAFAESVRQKTSAIFDAEFGRPDISLGWAVSRSMEDEYNEIFKAADQMMYREKKAYKAEKGVSLSGALPKQYGYGHRTGDSGQVAMPEPAPAADVAAVAAADVAAAVGEGVAAVAAVATSVGESPVAAVGEGAAAVAAVAAVDAVAVPELDPAGDSVFGIEDIPAYVPEPAAPAPTPAAATPAPVAPAPGPEMVSEFAAVAAVQPAPLPAAPAPEPAAPPIQPAPAAPALDPAAAAVFAMPAMPKFAPEPVPEPTPAPAPAATPAPATTPAPVPKLDPAPAPAATPAPKKSFAFTPPAAPAPPASAPAPEPKKSFTFVPPK
jgi:diguanylate cyclase (GGDEF)-like protein